MLNIKNLFYLKLNSAIPSNIISQRTTISDTLEDNIWYPQSTEKSITVSRDSGSVFNYDRIYFSYFNNSEIRNFMSEHRPISIIADKTSTFNKIFILEVMFGTNLNYAVIIKNQNNGIYNLSNCNLLLLDITTGISFDNTIVIQLNGSLNGNSTFTISNNRAAPVLISLSNQTSSALNLNGTALALQCNGILIDVVDNPLDLITLVRNRDIMAGTINFYASANEWDKLSTNNFIHNGNDPCIVYDDADSSATNICCSQDTDCPTGLYCNNGDICASKTTTLIYIIVGSVGGLFIIIIISVSIVVGIYRKRKAKEDSQIILTGNDLHIPIPIRSYFIN